MLYDISWSEQTSVGSFSLKDMSYSNKEKEPTLVCSDQDMSYSIKEKEPTLVCSDQDMSYSIKKKETYPDLSKPVLALSP
jgi:hypothetical protein